jgi:hypothetical protein
MLEQQAFRVWKDMHQANCWSKTEVESTLQKKVGTASFPCLEVNLTATKTLYLQLQSSWYFHIQI